ncbi:hypothetical protein GCM10011492_12380 [Flexivirga endophytica]|uniref:Antitoxin n=1 Tax=Flexivirga endophytica TaxID=1849103 RepID=A0A916SZ92_9MICO|nr:antitoxin [Flexivirga endophytica]GGB23999.1 hypothetical protein GCM10011492_12380 [Flexivirga endophytica]GHB57948.1 hypothetical protein GCM10008112_28920 [Flexivirga endophytica]
MPNSEDFKKNAGDAAQQAKEKAGKLAHENRDKFAGVLGKLTSKIDEKTQGKYHDKLEKAQDAALKGADKLAEQRPDTGGAPGTTGPTPGDGQVPPPTEPGQTPPSGS